MSWEPPKLGENATPEFLIDEAGPFHDQEKEGKKAKEFYKTAIKARLGDIQDGTVIRGDVYKAEFKLVVRDILDQEAVKKILESHGIEVPMTTIETYNMYIKKI